MGNCLRKSSKSEKKVHRIKTKSKNDKFFTYTPFECDPDLLVEMNKFNLESMLQQLAAEKSKFMDLLPLCNSSESTLQKLVLEIQKGLYIQKQGCSKLPQVFIRVSLHPDGPSFDTPGSYLELPSWFYIFEIMHNIHSFKSLKFTAFCQKKDKDAKIFASFKMPLGDLENQQVKHDWIKMKSKLEGIKRRPRILIRLQWVHDEQTLVKTMIEECSTKMQTIEDLLLSHQISIN